MGSAVLRSHWRAELAEADEHARPDRADLRLEERLAGQDLVGLGVAVLGRPAFQDVRDADVGPPHLQALLDDVGQELPGPAHEREALLVLFGPRRLADEHRARPAGCPGRRRSSCGPTPAGSAGSRPSPPGSPRGRGRGSSGPRGGRRRARRRLRRQASAPPADGGQRHSDRAQRAQEAAVGQEVGESLLALAHARRAPLSRRAARPPRRGCARPPRASRRGGRPPGRPSRRRRTTAFVSPPKPAPAAVTSLATTRSRFFASSFFRGVGDEVLGLRREADEDAPALRLPEPLQDVGGADELERRRRRPSS